MQEVCARMHMRKKKWARPELSACPYYIPEPKALRGAWRGRFAKEGPLHLELGCGKGVSTSQMAHENPGINYIAVDISPDVLGCTRRNLEKAYGGDPVDNILITRQDIERIDTVFAPEDNVERVIISFCNPWTMRPKHHKRRLTHPRQLMQYRAFMAEGGEIWFKTDDAQLFHDSLKYFEVCGFDAVYLTDDLHASGFAPNYVSEHEQMYTAQGIPIRFGIFRKSAQKVTMDPVRWRVWGMAGEDAPEDDTAEEDENE